MKLGMQVRLGPGHFVLDEDLAPPPKKGNTEPNFLPMSIVAKQLDAHHQMAGWIKMPLGMEVGLSPGNSV